MAATSDFAPIALSFPQAEVTVKLSDTGAPVTVAVWSTPWNQGERAKVRYQREYGTGSGETAVQTLASVGATEFLIERDKVESGTYFFSVAVEGSPIVGRPFTVNFKL